MSREGLRTDLSYGLDCLNGLAKDLALDSNDSPFTRGFDEGIDEMQSNYFIFCVNYVKEN